MYTCRSSVALVFLSFVHISVAPPPRDPSGRPPPNHSPPIPTSSPTPASPDEPDICLTPACVKAAANIMEAMDMTVNPCDNFFDYACGSWNRRHVIPDDKSSYSTFTKLRDNLHATLKGLLEAPSTSNEISAVTEAKLLYQSCLNTSAIESRRGTPMLELLGSLGGWPVLENNFDDASFDITATLADERLVGRRSVFSMGVGADDRDSNTNVIQIDQARLGMPSRDYYLGDRHDPILLSYQTFASDVAKLMGANPERADREMEEMVDFEIRLANITTPNDQRRDREAMYNKMTLSELYNLTQEIDWTRYMGLVFSNVSVRFVESQAVVVYARDYLVRLGQLLSVSPKRQVANYLKWRTAMGSVAYMSQDFIDARRSYVRALLGTVREEERWSKCVSSANRNFGNAVGRMFIGEHFDEDAKADAVRMISMIKDAFEDLLDDVPWLDGPTRQVAHEKAMNIQEQIGYPDYITNDTALNADWNETEMVGDQFFDNILTLRRAAVRDSLRTIGAPVDKSRWYSSPAVVNAYYFAKTNQITFPAGILQPPFYHSDHPKSMNFGGIGMVVGHEITHGFDDKGRQYDKDGNLKQWWSDSVIESFKERAQCIIDQYGNFTVPQVNMNLNGVLTLGENIADNGGLKQAFRAYRTWVEEQGREEAALPGLSLTHNQIFFLSFAQVWCGTARHQSHIRSIRSGAHSARRFRVIGPLSNSNEFQEAFNCASGSGMNPTRKCSVW